MSRNPDPAPMMKPLLLALGLCLPATLAHAWWANRNDWGVLNGSGSYAAYTTWKVAGSHDFRSDWSGVTRNPGAYVVLFPSAVEGWNSGDGAPGTDFLVGLNEAGSFAGCYFVPNQWNNWDANDVWNTALDVWCHTSSTATTQSDEVMLWVKWKGIAPLGSISGYTKGRELWYGWIGWSVRTIKQENLSGSIDVRQLCLDAGVPAARKITGIHAGSEVGSGSANLKLVGYSTWWKNNASSPSRQGY
ncbi:MAG: hypothetical protein ABII82_11835 [Verrucomicrobiota bacterium]